MIVGSACSRSFWPLALLGLLGAGAGGAEPSITPAPAAELPASVTPSQEFQDFITRLAREQLPDKYEKSKNWGQTRRVWDGVEVRREGLHWHTRRKWKEKNDGAWQMYRVDLVDPDQHFEVRIEKIRQAPGGKITAQVTAVAKLHVTGRHTQWESGVQLLSISAAADATVRLKADVVVATKFDFSRLPPALQLEPRIAAADLELVSFKLQRISHFSGPVVKSLSATVREVLEDKLADNRQKLVEKLNQSLEKQQAKLHFSAADLVATPWSKLLPATGK